MTTPSLPKLRYIFALECVSYRSINTIANKCNLQAQYVNEKKLAGVALWSVDEDNFLNDDFTLLQAINESLD